MKASTSMNPLKTKADIHLLRKVFHFLGVVAIMAFYHNLPYQKAVILLSMISIIVFALEAIRFKFPIVNKYAVMLMGPFMRSYEKNALTGTSYMLLGALIVIVVFPKIIAMLSFSFLAVADPAASYFGVRFGKDKLIGNKSLQGATAAFVCCSIISIIYFLEQGLFTNRVLFVAILAGLIGSASELIKVKNLDDNLTLPVISACSLWVLFTIFGGI
ncbi:hypothetical protein N9W41_00645 [bacterium]|nr:hypothetical protein [bacterium]